MYRYALSSPTNITIEPEASGGLDSALAQKIEMAVRQDPEVCDCLADSGPIYRECLGWYSFALSIWGCVAVFLGS